MKTKLQHYFPIIRSREEIVNEINENRFLKNIFYNWPEERQEQFLDYCSGAKGLKILYDSYFKEVFSPESAPERLERLLSLFLRKSVKILQILPNDSVRISDEESLLVTDIIVQLEDGTLANIEVQKIGYLFPGQRAACYGADLLLRQYKRVRSEKKKKFRYKDIKDVYVIVFFETSPEEFHEFPDTYCHFFEQKSDTGLHLNLLEKFIFIPLDIFLKNIHNKENKNELDAWLSFLVLDSPEDIIALIEEYPEFKPLYQHIYDMCRNVERMMGMFSEELRIMDKNTARYMVDQMQQELNKNKLIMKDQAEKLQKKITQIREQHMQIQEQDAQIQAQNSQIQEQDAQIQEQVSQIQEQNSQIQEQNSQIQAQNSQIQEQNSRIQEQVSQIQKQDSQIQEQNSRIQEQVSQIKKQSSQIQEQNSRIQELEILVQKLLKESKN